MLPSSHYSADIFQNFHISDSEQYPPQIFLSSACQPVQESQPIACCSTVQYSTVQYSEAIACCGVVANPSFVRKLVTIEDRDK